MYRTATYWPPGSWESDSAARGQNITVRLQALWAYEGLEAEVYLLVDVAEGGYIFDGESNISDPRKVTGARKIDVFLSHPDLRSLKQVRKAILARVSADAAA